MKKYLIMIASSLLILVGCSDAYTNIKDKNQSMVKIGDAQITKGSIYKDLMANYGSYFVLGDATEKILDLEVETTEEMNKLVEDQINQYKSSYGDSWETIIKMYGHKDEEALKSSIIYAEKLKELTKKYIYDNYQTLVSLYNPKQAIVLTFSDTDSANAALVELKNGVNPAEVGTAYNSTTSGEPQIVTTESNFTSEVKAILNTASSNDDFAVIPSADGTLTYVIKVVDTDVENIKAQIVDEFVTYSKISDEADKFYFNKHKFKIYDKDLYDAFTSNYSGYLTK